MRSAQLLVSDLVTHRVRDATADCEGMLGLEAFLTSQCLHVEVTDEGRPTDLANRRQEQPILGFELQVIAELADRWGVRHNSVRHNTIDTLWFELDV